MPLPMVEDPPRMYCVFCRTGEEQSIASKISAFCGCLALPLRKEKRECRKGQWVTFAAAALPGYLFLYADEEVRTREVLRIGGVYRFLQDADGIADLAGNDRAFAKWVFTHHGVVSISTAVREGDHVVMVEGPLKELSGRIVRVDKRKCIAKVAVEMANAQQYIWLSFDWLRQCEA